MISRILTVIALSLNMLALPIHGASAAASFIQEFELPENISTPNSLRVDASGVVWFAEKVGKNIAMYDPDKKVFTAFPIPASWGNVGPSLITLGPKGNVWFSVRKWANSEDRTNFLGEFTPADASFKKHDLFVKTGELLVDSNRVIPEDLVVDGKGVVWFLVPFETALFRYDPVNGALKGYVVPSKNSYPRGITVDGKGVIWFAEANANMIAKFDPERETFNEYDITTPFAVPVKVAVSGDGNIWFVQMRTSRLGVFYPALERFDEALLPALRSSPSAVAADGNGKIWFLEYLSNKVGVFDPKQALFREFVIPTPSSLPGDMAIDAKRSRLWFSETNTEAKRLGMIDIGKVPMTED